jgi:TRAP-type C4-dicarboxylate transport system permease small subunit
MSTIKIVAIVLIVGGILGLLYGGFTYTKDTHDAKIGPVEFSIKDKETVKIPIWISAGALIAGGILLLKKKG